MIMRVRSSFPWAAVRLKLLKSGIEPGDPAEMPLTSVEEVPVVSDIFVRVF